MSLTINYLTSLFLKSLTFLAINISSGGITGTVLAVIDLSLVELYSDSVIIFETQRKISQREIVT